MLFNSYEFIFIYLPTTLFLYFVLRNRFGSKGAIGFLVFASLFFYGWWNPKYLLLLAPSICINYLLGLYLANVSNDKKYTRIFLLTFGISLNISLIGYFKYANFFVENFNYLSGQNITLETIILPLAISFFTFQQVAFLVDAYRKLCHEHSFLDYCLFVSFFPQLIAGPIVHHSEMMPQFRDPNATRFQHSNIAVGVTIFAIGLFKKAVLADGIAVYASPAFSIVDGGGQLDFFAAWGGALAYTLQLYFDFSGYSDMAIGAARMFGIKLPVNFHSPYKATNIIDFWRRWHMTLSRFLRDYVYISLGGNRRGPALRYVNLSVTMLVGGLWHGAGWNFVIWGALHGFYLIVNHFWHLVRRTLNGGELHELGWFGRRAAQVVTLIAVIVGWVFFRATTLDGAVSMLGSMAGLNGLLLPSIVSAVIPAAGQLTEIGIRFGGGGGEQFVGTWLWILALIPIALIAPNTQQLMRAYDPALGLEEPPQRPSRQMNIVLRAAGWIEYIQWHPTRTSVAAIAILLTAGILALPQVSEFLYFQF